LSKIKFAPRAESGPIFDFYLGKYTPERKDCIMDGLVALVGSFVNPAANESK
jgi:hypothetical protein